MLAKMNYLILNQLQIGTQLEEIIQQLEIASLPVITHIKRWAGLLAQYSYLEVHL